MASFLVQYNPPMPSARDKRSWIRRPARRGIAAILALAASVVVTAPGAAEPFQMSVYAGRWGIEKDGTASELGVEVQRPLKYSGFDLMAGLAGTNDEAFWAYLGATWSWQPNDKWRVRPGFAVSVFDEGDGKDLGGPIEFRSSLEATYQLRNEMRLGLMVYHLSNAGFYDLNPGVNSLVFVVGFP